MSYGILVAGVRSRCDCLVDEPEAPRNATTLNLRVRDAGLTAQAGHLSQRACHERRSASGASHRPPSWDQFMLKNTVTTLTRLSAACAAVAAISLVQPVFAQTQAPAASPAPAEAAANRSPELSLQATASSEVKQDTVRIALAAEVEGRTSRLRASSARCWTTWSSGRATPRASKCARVITTSGPIPAARARSPAGAGKAK